MKSLVFVIVAMACTPDVDPYPVQPASQRAPYSATFFPDAGATRDAGPAGDGGATRFDGGTIPLDAATVPRDAGAPTGGTGTILDAASVPLDAF